MRAACCRRHALFTALHARATPSFFSGVAVTPCVADAERGSSSYCYDSDVAFAFAAHATDYFSPADKFQRRAPPPPSLTKNATISDAARVLPRRLFRSLFAILRHEVAAGATPRHFRDAAVSMPPMFGFRMPPEPASPSA
jgi:hypothetical protein